MVMEIALKLKNFAIRPANAQVLEWLLIGVKRDLDHKVLLLVFVISLGTWVRLCFVCISFLFNIQRLFSPFFRHWRGEKSSMVLWLGQKWMHSIFVFWRRRKCESIHYSRTMWPRVWHFPGSRCVSYGKGSWTLHWKVSKMVIFLLLDNLAS